MKTFELDAWIEGYLDYQRDVRRLAHRSVVDIRCTLRNVSGFFDEHYSGLPLYKARLEDLLRWVNREREKGRSDLHLAKSLSHVRGMLEYAWRTGRTDRNVLDGFNMKPLSKGTSPTVLTLDEAEALVLACPARTAQERRDRMVVLLLYGCGLRNRELRDLDIKDIDMERRELFVRMGKGDRQRTVPVPSAVWTELLAYLAEQSRRRGPLFRTLARRKRIAAKDTSAIVREATARAGIGWNVTPKVLRHSFATHLIERGVDIAVISSLMGHRNPSETGVYLHSLGQNREGAVELLSDQRRMS